MTRRIRAFALSLSFVLSLAPTLGAQGPVTIPGSQSFTMRSKSGHDYRINVWLPPAYDKAKGTYPAFYLVDGNLFLATAAEIYRGLMLGGEWPQLILVGVGYPESSVGVYSPKYADNRTRDYTPTPSKPDRAVASSGGHSQEFLAFLKTELMPAIESRYHADPKDRGLGGHSLGGLFTTYALLHEPGLFSHYWIGSPSLWWGDRVAYGWVNDAAKSATPPHGRAYLTVGGLEGFMATDMRRMADSLKRRFPALHSEARTYDGESHMSVTSPAIMHALKFLYSAYGAPKITLSAADIADYAGHWRAPSGQTLDLRPNGQRLALSFPYTGNTIESPMEAVTRDSLYMPTLGMIIDAKRDAKGKVARLHWRLIGEDATFERTK